MQEIQSESEGASDTLKFLKEHNRKTREKADLKKAIDKSEARVKEA